MKTKTVNLWWGPPANFNERKHERKISWLELFYDLVYVAAIGQLTHHLAEEPTWAAAAFVFLLFSLIFWSWVNGSQYFDLHGNDSIRTRVFTFIQVIAAASVAITLGGVFEGHQQEFVAAFSIVQIFITYLWWSVGLYDPSHRVLNKFYTFNYLLGFGLLVISFFTSFKVAILLWILVLILDLTPALTGARTIVSVLKKRGQVFTASAALVERFGLFTIIVLAESILGTVTAIAEHHQKSPLVWAGFALAIFIAFLLWSIYFDMTSEQETKKGYAYMQWLIFLHFPLLASLNLVGACTKSLLFKMQSANPLTTYWMYCISLAIILWMIIGIARIMQEEEEDRAYIRPVSRLLWAASFVILLIPLLGEFLNTLIFLSLIAAVLMVPVFVGIKSWVNYKFFATNKSAMPSAPHIN